MRISTCPASLVCGGPCSILMVGCHHLTGRCIAYIIFCKAKQSYGSSYLVSELEDARQGKYGCFEELSSSHATTHVTDFDTRGAGVQGPGWPSQRKPGCVGSARSSGRGRKGRAPIGTMEGERGKGGAMLDAGWLLNLHLLSYVG